MVTPARPDNRLITTPQPDRDGIMGAQTGLRMRLEWMWEDRSRTTVLLISGAIILALAVVDWWTKPYVSIGFLYLFPIMLAAGFLPRWVLALLGLACAGFGDR